MRGDGSRVELVVLPGGRSDADGQGEGPASRGLLRMVRGGPTTDLQAALEETVAAARQVRRDIEQRIAHALEDLLRPRAPDGGAR